MTRCLFSTVSGGWDRFAPGAADVRRFHNESSASDIASAGGPYAVRWGPPILYRLPDGRWVLAEKSGTLTEITVNEAARWFAVSGGAIEWENRGPRTPGEPYPIVCHADFPDVLEADLARCAAQSDPPLTEYESMLSERERRAIRGHAAIIERYEADREREESRLRAPHEEKGRELWARLHEGADSLVRPPGFYGPAELVWDDPSIRKEAFEIHDSICASLAAFDAAHRPSVEPFDTPRKLVAWIDDKLDWLGKRRVDLLSYTETGREVLKERGWERRPGDPPSYPADEIRDVYREARGRALAFIHLAPNLPGELTERGDPVLGLQDIRACFALMSEDKAEPRGDEPTATTAVVPDEGSPGVRSPGSRPTGPMYLRKAHELLSSIRDQARELGRFWEYPGYPWNGVGVLLWGSIREFERHLSGGFEGTLGATADEVHSMAWASSILRRLPKEEEQFSVEGFEALRALTSQETLEAIETIVAKLAPRSPIAAYLADVEFARASWDESCRLRQEIRRRDPEADPPHGEDYRTYRRRLDEAESRHFPGVDPRTGAGLDTPSRLWRWIVDRLWMWENIEPTVVAMGLGSPHPCWDDLVKTYGQLHRIGLPGAPRPPYVRTMTEREAMDEMYSIAHSIKGREVEEPRTASSALGMPSPSANPTSTPISLPRPMLMPLPLEDQSVVSAALLEAQADVKGKDRDRSTGVDVEGLTEAEMATRLFKERRRNQGRLVEFMADRGKATYEAIAREVHGDDVASGDAIEKNVSRTNEKMTEFGSRIRYRCASSHVFKEVSPE